MAQAFGSGKLNVVNIVDGAAWQPNPAGEEKLRLLLPETTLDFQYIKEDSTTGGILNFIVTSSTDILCLVKRHHNIVYRVFNSSTVNKVLNRSIKAVLVLHE